MLAAMSMLALGAPLEPATAPSQILILGMHHSGTSVVSNLTMMMGAFGGQTDELLLHPENPLKFWERRRLSLPHFAKAAAIAFSMTPSSASVERIFSLYKSMFGTEQLHALRDYIQSAMMLNFNERDI